MMQHSACPFRGGTRRLTDAYPGRDALAGPVAFVDHPCGDLVAIVTDPEVARAALDDPRLSKDPALAPSDRIPELEQAADQALSLTTSEGEVHARLRRAHAPLLSAKRMRARAPSMRATARALLAAAGPGPVDLCADFTTRYPLVVIGELLGVPAELVDEAVPACRAMLDGDPGAMGVLMRIAGSALSREGLAQDLRARLPMDASDDDLPYLLFALLFAGQLTTDAALGFLLARALTEPDAGDVGDLVEDVLRRDPPAPFTLWRFTVEEVELGGVRLPASTPVLVDVAGIDARLTGVGLAFGHGPHYCVGAQLARIELAAVVEVLRAEFPDARLAVAPDELRRVDPGTTAGSHLAALPVEGLTRRA